MRENATSGIEEAFQELLCFAENSLPADCKAAQQCRRKKKAVDIKTRLTSITIQSQENNYSGWAV